MGKASPLERSDSVWCQSVNHICFNYVKAILKGCGKGSFSTGYELFHREVEVIIFISHRAVSLILTSGAAVSLEAEYDFVLRNSHCFVVKVTVKLLNNFLTDKNATCWVYRVEETHFLIHTETLCDAHMDPQGHQGSRCVAMQDLLEQEMESKRCYQQTSK